MIVTHGRVANQVHGLLKEVLEPGQTYIDATVGNGYDTVFLAEALGETGKVYGFDIQSEAIQSTREKLIDKSLEERVTLIQQGHEHMKEFVHEDVHGVIFNLGYLPGSDKSIITKANTTLDAVCQGLNLLIKGGHVLITSYYGHLGGMEEKDALEVKLRDLPLKEYSVTKLDFLNRGNCPPIIYIIEKK